jgi:hypothetical protein
MTFDVYTPFGTQHYAGNARYDVEHPGGGLLTVWTHDGDKITYGPMGWIRVAEWQSEHQGGSVDGQAAPPPPDPVGPAPGQDAR